MVRLVWTQFGSGVAEAKIAAENRWASIVAGHQPHWLWEALLQSAATNGGAKHLDRLAFIRSEFVAVSGVDPFAWEAITKYDEGPLLGWLGVAANPHFQRWEGIRDRLAEFVAANRDTLPKLSERILRGNRNACIDILNDIPGVRDKYARNLMMDVGHPQFMDGSFALDSRISGFLETITGIGHAYRSRSRTKWTEDELVGIAHDVGLSAWEMDRLIFGYWPKFTRLLEIPKTL